MAQMKKKQLKLRWEVYLIGVFVILLPFIVYFHQETLTMEGQRVFAADNGVVTDYFIYYKECLLLTVAAVLVLSFLADVVTKSGRIRRELFGGRTTTGVLLFAGASAALILLSALRASLEGRADTVWMGIHTEGEGVLTLLAYLVLFLAGYFYFREEQAGSLLKRCLVILMGLVSVLAVIDVYTGGIYGLDFMNKLIAPEGTGQLTSAMDKVSLGCYNPGYFGGLCAMLFPTAVIVTYTATGLWHRIGGALLAAGLLVAQFLAGSTGPVYATAAGTVILVPVLRRNPKKMLITAACIIGSLLVCGTIGNVCSDGKLVDMVAEVILHPDTVGQDEQHFYVSSMQIEDGVLKVAGEEHTFYIDAPKGEHGTLADLHIYDKEGMGIESRLENEKCTFVQEGYEGVTLSNEAGMLLLDLGYEEGVWFYVTDQGIRLAGQNGVKLDSIPQPEVTGMEKWYGLATGRGYTWVQSLPLLKKCLLLGEGAGNFVYLFRQNEVAGLLNTHGSSQFVLDKPHNWYIQMAVNNGCIAVVLFLVLLVCFAVKGVKKYILPRQLPDEELLGASLLTGVGVYAITGLVNDSIVTVSPVFWLICGIGCAMAGEGKKSHE